jgi:hypothetical protein
MLTRLLCDAPRRRHTTCVDGALLRDSCVKTLGYCNSTGSHVSALSDSKLHNESRELLNSEFTERVSR